MIGKKLYKNNAADMAQYTDTAIWCNANNAMIEDRGEYYEVVSIPAPRMEEQLAQLDEQYNADKAELLTAYQTALVYGDTETMESLKADLQALDDQYDEDYEKIVGGE
jgi:septal ring factor EnvC (AmiA/AmiB activator)